jgi:hypothetical protein
MWATRLTPRLHEASRIERMLRSDPPWLTRDPTLRGEQRRRAAAVLPPADPPAGFYMREIEASLGHTLVAWEAEEQGAAAARAGIRLAHPYWDPDLVELMLRTPPRVLNAGGRSKGLVRQSLHRRFPEIGLGDQRKVSAISFWEAERRREGPALLAAAGDFPALSRLGLVDGQSLAVSVHRNLTMNKPKGKHIWLPLGLEMWVRAHGDTW